MKRIPPQLLIIGAASLLFMHSLGKAPLFDWDEINFAESAREMIETGNFMQVQVNYEPFWEKPPLYFWMTALSMKVFGVNEFAARFPNAVCGIVTLLVIFSIGRRLHSERFAAWWTLIHAGTFLPHLYFQSGIIDPWFNLFIFLGIYFLSGFLSGVQKETNPLRSLLLSALFTGMAVLTKGPVAILVLLLTYFVFLILNRWKGLVPFRYYLTWGAGVLLVTLLWFGLEIMQHGWWFVNEFVTYQVRLAKTRDAGHGGFLLYHFVVLLIGCFPASLLIFGPAGREASDGPVFTFRKMMVASFIVILVVFTLVRTKIVHYSSFTYFPIGYLAAATVQGLAEGRWTLRRWQQVGLLIIGLIWSLVFIGLPLLGNNIQWLKPLLEKDPFAVANLQADVSWGQALMLPGILFLVAVLVAYSFMRRGLFERALIVLFISCIAMMQVAVSQFAPRIEQYSQHAAIEFFKTLQGKDVYADTYGYKSYAPYFYSAVRPGNRKESKDDKWLMTGPVDKPTYLVIRVNKKEMVLREFGDKVTVLYEKNGFVFLQRK